MSSAAGAGQARWVCQSCGQAHQVVKLRYRQRAVCIRCSAVVATRSSGRTPALAYALTGAVLAVPALLLPFLMVDKFGAERVTRVSTGVSELWAQGMHWLGVWVLICGLLAPIGLMGILIALLAKRHGAPSAPRNRRLWRTARALEKWAMPEVQLLAVLVAFTKLESVVNVRLGAGFWCYTAMSISCLLAWRSFELDPVGEPAALDGGDGTAA